MNQQHSIFFSAVLLFAALLPLIAVGAHAATHRVQQICPISITGLTGDPTLQIEIVPTTLSCSAITVRNSDYAALTIIGSQFASSALVVDSVVIESNTIRSTAIKRQGNVSEIGHLQVRLNSFINADLAVNTRPGEMPVTKLDVETNDWSVTVSDPGFASCLSLKMVTGGDVNIHSTPRKTTTKEVTVRGNRFVFGPATPDKMAAFMHVHVLPPSSAVNQQNMAVVTITSNSISSGVKVWRGIVLSAENDGLLLLSQLYITSNSLTLHVPSHALAPAPVAESGGEQRPTLLTSSTTKQQVDSCGICISGAVVVASAGGGGPAKFAVSSNTVSLTMQTSVTSLYVAQTVVGIAAVIRAASSALSSSASVVAPEFVSNTVIVSAVAGSTNRQTIYGVAITALAYGVETCLLSLRSSTVTLQAPIHVARAVAVFSNFSNTANVDSMTVSVSDARCYGNCDLRGMVIHELSTSSSSSLLSSNSGDEVQKARTASSSLLLQATSTVAGNAVTVISTMRTAGASVDLDSETVIGISITSESLHKPAAATRNVVTIDALSSITAIASNVQSTASWVPSETQETVLVWTVSSNNITVTSASYKATAVSLTAGTNAGFVRFALDTNSIHRIQGDDNALAFFFSLSGASCTFAAVGNIIWHVESRIGFAVSFIIFDSSTRIARELLERNVNHMTLGPTAAFLYCFSPSSVEFTQISRHNRATLKGGTDAFFGLMWAFALNTDLTLVGNEFDAEAPGQVYGVDLDTSAPSLRFELQSNTFRGRALAANSNGNQKLALLNVRESSASSAATQLVVTGNNVSLTGLATSSALPPLPHHAVSSTAALLAASSATCSLAVIKDAKSKFQTFLFGENEFGCDSASVASLAVVEYSSAVASPAAEEVRVELRGNKVTAHAQRGEITAVRIESTAIVSQLIGDGNVWRLTGYLGAHGGRVNFGVYSSSAFSSSSCSSENDLLRLRSGAVQISGDRFVVSSPQGTASLFLINATIGTIAIASIDATVTGNVTTHGIAVEQQSGTMQLTNNKITLAQHMQRDTSLQPAAVWSASAAAPAVNTVISYFGSAFHASPGDLIVSGNVITFHAALQREKTYNSSHHHPVGDVISTPISIDVVKSAFQLGVKMNENTIVANNCQAAARVEFTALNSDSEIRGNVITLIVPTQASASAAAATTTTSVPGQYADLNATGILFSAAIRRGGVAMRSNLIQVTAASSPSSMSIALCGIELRRRSPTVSFRAEIESNIIHVSATDAHANNYSNGGATGFTLLRGIVFDASSVVSKHFVGITRIVNQQRVDIRNFRWRSFGVSQAVSLIADGSGSDDVQVMGNQLMHVAADYRANHSLSSAAFLEEAARAGDRNANITASPHQSLSDFPDDHRQRRSITTGVSIYWKRGGLRLLMAEKNDIAVRGPSGGRSVVLGIDMRVGSERPLVSASASSSSTTGKLDLAPAITISENTIAVRANATTTTTSAAGLSSSSSTSSTLVSAIRVRDEQLRASHTSPQSLSSKCHFSGNSIVTGVFFDDAKTTNTMMQPRGVFNLSHIQLDASSCAETFISSNHLRQFAFGAPVSDDAAGNLVMTAVERLTPQSLSSFLRANAVSAFQLSSTAVLATSLRVNALSVQANHVQGIWCTAGIQPGDTVAAVNIRHIGTAAASSASVSFTDNSVRTIAFARADANSVHRAQVLDRVRITGADTLLAVRGNRIVYESMDSSVVTFSVESQATSETTVSRNTVDGKAATAASMSLLRIFAPSSDILFEHNFVDSASTSLPALISTASRTWTSRFNFLGRSYTDSNQNDVAIFSIIERSSNGNNNAEEVGGIATNDGTGVSNRKTLVLKHFADKMYHYVEGINVYHPPQDAASIDFPRVMVALGSAGVSPTQSVDAHFDCCELAFARPVQLSDVSWAFIGGTSTAPTASSSASNVLVGCSTTSTTPVPTAAGVPTAVPKGVIPIITSDPRAAAAAAMATAAATLSQAFLLVLLCVLFVMEQE